MMRSVIGYITSLVVGGLLLGSVAAAQSPAIRVVLQQKGEQGYVIIPYDSGTPGNLRFTVNESTYVGLNEQFNAPRSNVIFLKAVNLPRGAWLLCEGNPSGWREQNECTWNREVPLYFGFLPLLTN
jgi:hypothetical protein